MSKPMKKGLSYFPLDTGFVRDPKMQRLLLEFDYEGLCVFITVLCEVYASQGYYAAIKSGFYPDIGFILGLEEERVKEIIDFCLRMDLFDQSMFDHHGILTSVGVQRRYSVISKHTRFRIKPEYLLLCENNLSEPKNASYINENKNIEEKINENININKNINTRENINKNINQTVTENGKERSRKENDDSARRAELLRMAEAATRGGGDV